MKVFHKTIKRDYELLDKYEAGFLLTGAEVKSIRAGRINLTGSFVKIKDNEVFLINADVPVYKYARSEDYDSTRSRKLLLNKREIIRLKTKLKKEPNLTIVPIACYNKGRLIKLEIALAKGKKMWERKRIDKEKQEKRRVEEEMKEAIRK